MKLYELAEQFRQLQEMLEDENADAEVIKNTLELVEFDLTEKAENIAKIIKTLDYEIKVLEEEEQRIVAKKKSKENKRNWLKQYLQEQLEKAGLENIRTKLFTIYIQNNPPAVEIINEEEIPLQYIKYKPEIDKKSILEILKKGTEIPGVKLKASKSLRIR